MSLRFAVPALFCALQSPLPQTPSNVPVELGAVRWKTDHDQAFAEAKRGSKPVVILFQEIPG